MILTWLKKYKWQIGITVLLVIAILHIYVPDLPGFSSVTTNTEWDGNNKIKTVRVEQPKKTLWDLLSLVAVPLILAGLGLAFQRQEQRRAAENQREEALQAYFDRLSSLLVDKNLIAVAIKVEQYKEYIKELTPEEARLHSGMRDLDVTEQQELVNTAIKVIRARTLSLLRQFEKDEQRKTSVIRFLVEVEAVRQLKVDLSDANLDRVDLDRINLTNANFKNVTLKDANLNCAMLGLIKLDGSDLSHAKLNYTILNQSSFKPVIVNSAEPQPANLSFAELNNANLSYADLSSANLCNANLHNTDLSGTNLKGADLSNARNLTEEQVEKAKLCKTKLPKNLHHLNPNQNCAELGIPINEPD